MKVPSGMFKTSGDALRAFGLALLFVSAMPARADPVDTYIRTEMKNQHLPGLALAVIRADKPPMIRTYGESNLELHTPVTQETVFRLASLGKQMLSVGLMLLVNDGKLRLDDPVSRFLPDTPPSWSGITVRQVLNHTAGFPAEAPGFDPLVAKDNLDLIRTAYAVPLLSKPGEGFVYSNLGYFVVAEIIHKSSGVPWPQFMTERVFRPLHMNATRLTDVIDIVPNRASGYTFRDNVTKNVAPVIALRPSGPFLSTVTDMIKWDAGLRSLTLITKGIQDEISKTPTLPDGTNTGYGLGWRVDEVRGHRRIRHGGSQPGFRTEYTRFVDDQLSVIVLVNGESVRADDIALEVASQFIEDLSPARKTTAPSPQTLGLLAGRYQSLPATDFTIAADGQGLSVQATSGGAQFHLTAETDSVYFLSKNESYVFTRDPGGAMQLEVRLGTATSPGATQLEAVRAH